MVEGDTEVVEVVVLKAAVLVMMIKTEVVVLVM